jgi:alkanesulfonate monooxygenase SsuD/methylene tetrahydromethanopterin reductase-like flavin-dependent oxidoreductase (luciferase family)
MHGHINVGVLVSSDPDDPRDPMVEARHAEQLGFDLLTVHPDHPSASGVRGAGFTYEMWTAITWLAASTSRIRIVPSVISLPYRHPAVLAKMAESLDRLSGHRLIMALGAGGDDQAFESFGLPRWSPEEKVAALEEALDVVRRLWREPTGTHEGAYFRLKRGSINPRPSRDIPLWLGGHGSRMIELIGRSADGWLVSSRAFPDRARIRRALLDVRRSLERWGRDPGSFTYACNVDVLVSAGGDRVEFANAVAGGSDEVTAGLMEFVDMGFTQINLWTHGEHDRQRELLAENALRALRSLPFP